MKLCASCWDVFTARCDARYCSDTCRQRGYRQRKAGEKLPTELAVCAGAAPGKPSGGPRTAVGVFRPSPGKPPEAAPGPAVGPARIDQARRRADFIASLIG
jgi:hypothetical protein